MVGYRGKLDIRPPYQREFIYKDKQRDAVIDTIAKDFPLNVMYWAVRTDGGFEVIDGQQRTISICQFVDGDFSFEEAATSTTCRQTRRTDPQLRADGVPVQRHGQREAWRGSGPSTSPGEKLTEQELRNAVYSGPWVTDAKRHFSRPAAPAYGLGGDYMSGAPNPPGLPGSRHQVDQRGR